MSQRIEMYTYNGVVPTYQHTARYQDARQIRLARLNARFHENITIE